MRRIRFLLVSVILVTLTVGVNTAAPPHSSAASTAAARSWSADNGNGTYSNPLFYEEFEDPDTIRVGEDYYLAGTTMHMNPALIVLHSRDLVNWELASYCMDRLDLSPAFHLEGGNIYGRGIWAPCIRYHDGMFYVFSNVNNVGCQVFRSKSPDGPWARNQLPGMHDLSVLFDDDGKIYAISGATRPVIVELNKDITEIVPNTRRQMNAEGMGEGHHLYKINGKYYDVSAIPGAHARSVRFQVVDLGKGRVALKAGKGRFVSAAGDIVILRDLAGRTPGDAESFQWINLMRGDTMLMSVTNHRYLATKPNNPGPVTVSATGPQPDRKDGACFKWKAVQ